MALDLLNVFRALGCCAREGYLTAAGQADQYSPFNQLSQQPGVNPAWLAPLAQSYDPGIRIGSSQMGLWEQAAQSLLLSLVTADDPFYGASVDTALQFLDQQMKAQGASVRRCVVGSSVVADPANVGTGVVVVALTRADGVPLENTVAEESTLLITADSYTGGATAGREPWRWAGAQNNSSLGTGAAVGTWDFDNPRGSNGSASGSCVSADEDANAAGNLLTNGDFEDWAGTAPAVLKYWKLRAGVWGTDVIRSTSSLAGAYCVKFVAGAVPAILTTQFNSAVFDGADSAAGTTAAVAGLTGYAFNLWLKADGVVTAGVLTVDLVDGSSVVINDQAGTPNTFDIDLTALTTSYAAHNGTFRLPAVLPAEVRLRVRVTTGITGAGVYMDAVAFCRPAPAGNLYAGGPNVAVFSNPAAPFEAAPDPDAFTLTFANDRGGAVYGATWQTKLYQLFGRPFFLAPSSASPTIPDSLITGGVPRLAAYYPLNGRPNGVLSDASGNARDAAGSAPAYSPGKFWQSLSAGSATYTGAVAFASLSLSVWGYWNGVITGGSGAQLDVSDGTPTKLLQLILNRATAAAVVNGVQVWSTSTAASGVWHHLAISYTGGTATVFFDGVLVYTAAAVVAGPGATVNFSGDGRGWISDPAVLLDGITQAEVIGLYAGGPGGAGRPVLPYPP